MYSIYLDSSNQKDNIGVGNYGNECAQMNAQADLIAYYIKLGKGDITVYRNNASMSLYDTKEDANNKNVYRVLSLHTNAGGGVGTEGYHYPNSVEGYNFIKKVYEKVAPITISNDRGIKEADFYILRETNAIAGLIEIMFHDSIVDVNDYLNKINQIAKSIALAIYEEFGLNYIEPEQQQLTNVFFRVMCGSFQNKENALKRKEELKKYGFESVIMAFEK